MTEPALPDKLMPRDTRRSLPIALLRAREAVMVHFRPMLARRDVTEQQWRVIRVLAQAGKLDASELAERAFILAPSLTRILKSIEERGLVARSKDAGDGRRVLLEITQAGRELINDVTPDSRAIYARIEQAYGKKRIDALLDMLDELANAAAK
jgi:homoprotocatechuate degradation regulator HpaR